MPVIPKKLKAEGTKTVKSGPTETPKIAPIGKVARAYRITRNWSHVRRGDFRHDLPGRGRRHNWQIKQDTPAVAQD